MPEVQLIPAMNVLVIQIISEVKAVIEENNQIAGRVAHWVTFLALERLLDTAQFAMPARLLRLLQRALLAVFVD